MKNIRKITAFIFALILMLTLASCSDEIRTDRGDKIKAQCMTVIDAMLACDENAAADVFHESLDREAFAKSFASLCAYTDGVTSYELTQIGWYAGMENGMSYYRASFRMTSDKGNFVIIGMEVDGYDGLYNFRIMTEEEADPSFTGTLTTIPGSNPAQIAMLALAALFFAFTVWMLIDCVKRKLKNPAKWYKPLWLVIIACGVIAFTLTVTAGNLRFASNIAIFLGAYSHLQIYSNGNFVFNLVVPFGAVIYFFMRKRITYREEAPEPEVITVESSENTENNEENI